MEVNTLSALLASKAQKAERANTDRLERSLTPAKQTQVFESTEPSVAPLGPPLRSDAEAMEVAESLSELIRDNDGEALAAYDNLQPDRVRELLS